MDSSLLHACTFYVVAPPFRVVHTLKHQQPHVRRPRRRRHRGVAACRLSCTEALRVERCATAQHQAIHSPARPVDESPVNEQVPGPLASRRHLRAPTTQLAQQLRLLARGALCRRIRCCACVRRRARAVQPLAPLTQLPQQRHLAGRCRWRRAGGRVTDAAAVCVRCKRRAPLSARSVRACAQPPQQVGLRVQRGRVQERLRRCCAQLPQQRRV
mmetsp:Transcript_42620/g.127916  ORF Transcript_42620/g.127916 Transcript_42620/m.127916 type:complete len:214 (+) Transcript_42620:954-1595(+)